MDPFLAPRTQESSWHWRHFRIAARLQLQERKLLNFLLDGPFQELSAYEDLEHAPHLNVGVDDPEFRNFAGIYSDAIFDIFYQFAKANLKKKRPLVIAGGCGLNCDWNSKWKESGLFTRGLCAARR